MFINNKYTVWYYNIIKNAKLKENVIKQGYYETHHVIPRSLGGNDLPENLVHLTSREHFICHLLLVKMVTGKQKYQMQKAVLMTLINNPYQKRLTINSRLFAKLKEDSALAQSKLTRGKPKHTDESKRILSEKAKGRVSPFKGRKMTDEQRANVSDGRRRNGTKLSEKTIAKIVKANTGKKRSEEAKRNLSEGQKKRDKSSFHHPSDEVKRQISEKLKGRPSPLKGRPSKLKGRKLTEEVKNNMRESHKVREYIFCPYCLKEYQKANFSRWHGDNCKHK